MKKLSVKKGEILQHSGELNSKVYYVVSGLLRSYSIDPKGKEHIFMFAPEDWMIADGVTVDGPMESFIDALEDSEVIQQDKKDMGDSSHQFDKLIKRMHVLQKRIIMLMSATAIERYEYFVEVYPAITQRVPQKMIASYLGITPEALSTVKSQRLYKSDS